MKVASFTTHAVLAAARFIAVDGKPVGKLDARAECISVEDIEQWMIDNSYAGQPTAFWTAGATASDADTLAQNIGGVYYADVFGSKQGDWEGDCTEADELEGRMSEALAKQASSAYVVLGTLSVSSYHIWSVYEEPNLSDIVAVRAGSQEEQQPYDGTNPWQG